MPDYTGTGTERPTSVCTARVSATNLGVRETLLALAHWMTQLGYWGRSLAVPVQNEANKVDVTCLSCRKQSVHLTGGEKELEAGGVEGERACGHYTHCSPHLSVMSFPMTSFSWMVLGDVTTNTDSVHHSLCLSMLIPVLLCIFSTPHFQCITFCLSSFSNPPFLLPPSSPALTLTAPSLPHL